ncbi:MULTISPECIES: helix-turn-helix transcriptional regulator [Rhizobium]|uniref:Helix-turn-helix transcriptional regulator n=1 Tax=Rhizobium phaseoli TaxID=396 RepID=A0A7X6F888_9HYPH|nr:MULTISPECIES: helix-turn-helix transcriptional regulator [Rhizobium]MDE8763654.1 helix-turn-helix transcriptional regulator [Rhizobium sp. CBK13]NKF14858.1 helix-turn-helix transcriptional regulator [Rhizobium phaseoli]QPK09195.1 helix-turn-helix transcriptional regulator [Rhizobium phaseoli]
MARKFASNKGDALGMTKTVVFAEEVFLVMRGKSSGFRELLDAWITHGVGAAEGIYGSIIQHRPANSVIGILQRDCDMEIVGPYHIQTDIEFPGKEFVQRELIPACRSAQLQQRPISTRRSLAADGLQILSEWLVLPHKAQKTSAWCIAYVEIGFLLPVTQAYPSFDAADRGLLQMLAEGYQTKEIALRVGLSHRTVEHRFEKLKSRMGARSLPHLVALSIAKEL